MTWTIPNMLTIGRLLAAPAVALVFVALARPLADWIAFFLFVGAALTDFLDGWLARRWNQLSTFGKMFDPIADKAMVTIALFTLAAIHGPNPWLLTPAAIILLREVAVSGLREYLGAVKLDVTKLAKWKTTVQMVAIALLLLGGPLMEAGIVLLWVAAVLTAVTGWDYFSKGMRYMRGREPL